MGGLRGAERADDDARGTTAHKATVERGGPDDGANCATLPQAVFNRDGTNGADGAKAVTARKATVTRTGRTDGTDRQREVVDL